ncbi:MAG: hypothetical protein WBQ14_03955 [Gaiellaceae bacterium]
MSSARLFLFRRIFVLLDSAEPGMNSCSGQNVFGLAAYALPGMSLRVNHIVGTFFGRFMTRLGELIEVGCRPGGPGGADLVPVAFRRDQKGEVINLALLCLDGL